MAMLMAVATAVLGADSVNIKLSGVRYIVSYTDPVNDKSPATIDITFYNIKPSPYKAEQVLAANIMSSASINPEKDIIGTAWYSFAGDEGDVKILPIKNGAFHLSYSSTEKQLVPYEEYMKIYGNKKSEN